MRYKEQNGFINFRESGASQLYRYFPKKIHRRFIERRPWKTQKDCHWWCGRTTRATFLVSDVRMIFPMVSLATRHASIFEWHIGCQLQAYITRYLFNMHPQHALISVADCQLLESAAALGVTRGALQLADRSPKREFNDQMITSL